ncbi:hypothetical protein [Winogradskyella undariae]|uniref:hypothetical protein n=1 Tax=Winogradskyella undariae TaxID=1285465 RepID=UPI0015C861CF|nr:hypothetical protein [Winogradskyella undariae]
MATYKCNICGIYKNDTLNSQLNTSITCRELENNSEVIFHHWAKISEENWDYN